MQPRMRKKIKLRKKSGTSYLVLENDHPWGVLPGKILHFFSIQPEIETEIKAEVQQKLVDEIVKFAWHKLLHYLSYRERSIPESRRYLQQLPLRSDLIEKVINKAISYNYLNEKRFCELYILDLQNKFKSRREIINKLRTKGVSKTIINECLEAHFSPEKETEALEVLYRKAQIRYRSHKDFQQKEKILNYLTRKGFSYWQVKEIIEKE